MPKLKWDKVGSRRYESGLDRGVFYPEDGDPVPWNGLTSVVEATSKQTTPTFYDGRKINEIVTLGDFSAVLTAITYPDEFIPYEGGDYLNQGILATEQAPKFFALSYRTRVGNDVDGDEAHYKIHVIFNVLAIPSDKTYASLGGDPSLVEFAWDLTAVPEDYPGFKPTAHLIIDSKVTDPWLLEDLEAFLYGNEIENPVFPSLPEIVDYITSWYRVKIVVNDDGTWTAIEKRPGFITKNEDGEFEITNIKASYLTLDTFEISDTLHLNDSPLIRIENRGDGTWIATSDDDDLIVVNDDDTFEIRNLDPVYAGPDMYHISDKLHET